MNRFKLSTITTAIALCLTVSAAHADKEHHTGPFAFTPIDSSANSAQWNPAAPWKLPEGFSQRIVSGEADLNVYDNGRNDWHDMNTVNETGKHAGRYLYRTHEVRGVPEGGAVSVVDLKTGEARVLAQNVTWTALDGIVWTPWGTVLFAEENTNGRLFEIVLNDEDPMYGVVHERPAVGLLAHEGIQVGNDGAVYVVDEFRGQKEGHGGGIYKFVPDSYGDLSSGKLYVLKVTGSGDGTGQGEWVGPIDPYTAAQSGTTAGGTGYNRPEDLQIIGDTLYAAITEGEYVAGQQVYDGRVLAIDLSSMEVSNFVKPGVNVAVEIGKPGDANFQSGFDNPDNLAATPDGKLVIIEDNVPSDIWIAGKDKNHDDAADKVELFASLSDPKAEGTGIYFGKDPHTLFVNVQHSASPDGDATWAISRDKK
jgi:hypothetical protein